MARSRLVAMCILPVFALAACGATDPDAYEAEEFPPCSIDQGAWAGDARATRYVQTRFHDFSRQFDAFLDDVDRATGHAAKAAPDTWPLTFGPVHDAAAESIVRLGKVLPRMNRPLDLAPLSAQLEEGVIWRPHGGHHTEFLGVALAEEIAVDRDLSARLAGFLAGMERVEYALLELKTSNSEIAADPGTVAGLAADARKLREDWSAARLGMSGVIFGPSDAVAGEDLSERLQARITGYCASYLECTSADGSACGSNETGNGDSTHDPALDEPVSEEPGTTA